MEKIRAVKGKDVSELAQALREALQRLGDQTYLFLISGLIVLVISFVVLLTYQPVDQTPFYVLVGVSALLLAFGALYRLRGHTTRGVPPVQASDQSAEARLNRQLHEALNTLHHLENKAAGIPVTERTISLTRDLESQKELVDRLRQHLRDLTETP